MFLKVVFVIVAAIGIVSCENNSSTRGHDLRVRGDVVDISSYKYTVSIQVNNRHVCGGTIISEVYILTAAHCVEGILVPQVKIRAGSAYVTSEGVLKNVSQIAIHPSYFSIIGINDAAIVKLESPLEFNNTVGSVKLPNSNDFVYPLLMGDASGWGSSDGVQSELTNSRLLTFPPNYCWLKCPQSFCAGGFLKNAGTCKGDDGGPFVVNGVLLGIIRKIAPGMNCYGPMMTPIFLRVSGVRDFISEITGL